MAIIVDMRIFDNEDKKIEHTSWCSYSQNCYCCSTVIVAVDIIKSLFAKAGSSQLKQIRNVIFVVKKESLLKFLVIVTDS
jgi:hypothetical protein